MSGEASRSFRHNFVGGSKEELADRRRLMANKRCVVAAPGYSS